VRAGAVVFRLRPRGWPSDDPRLEPLNARLLEAVNATGEVRLSRVAAGGRAALRLAVGSRGAGARAVERAWAVLRAEALRLGATPPAVT
jgi:hypothetical protein